MTPSQQAAKAELGEEAFELLAVACEAVGQIHNQFTSPNDRKAAHARLRSAADAFRATFPKLTPREYLASVRSPAEEPAQAVPVGEIETMRKRLGDLPLPYWKQAHFDLKALLDHIDGAAGPAITPPEPTDRQLSNIARAIAETMRFTNHIKRAKAVWQAAFMDGEHPWPTSNRAPSTTSGKEDIKTSSAAQNSTSCRPESGRSLRDIGEQ
jgi:hypothetical protein